MKHFIKCFISLLMLFLFISRMRHCHFFRKSAIDLLLTNAFLFFVGASGSSFNRRNFFAFADTVAKTN